MAQNTQRIGWIGMGRMGFPMAERLLKAGHDVSIWNRTRAKAEPLAAKGGKIVDKLSDLAGLDVVFSIVSTGKDLDRSLLRPERPDHRRQRPAAENLRRLLHHRGRGVGRYAPPPEREGRRLRGGAGERQRQGVKAGKLSSVTSGPEAPAARSSR